MRRTRIVIGLVLCTLLFGSFVHYGAARADHWPYPSDRALATDYDAHIGEQVFVFGTVEDINDERIRIRVRSEVGPFTLTVRDPEASPAVGGIVQVYGTLQSDHTVDAERTVVVNESGGSDLYKYGVSAVGAVVVLVSFFRHWTVDTDRWVLEVREDG